jgi:hypothetical protein
LLPIWKRLPNESTRVYRLQTDEGERIVGRKVSPPGRPTRHDRRSARAADAFMALMDGRTILDLAEGFSFAASASWAPTASSCRLHRHDARAPHRLRPVPRDHLLEARMFVPTDAPVPRCWALLGRYPVQRIGEREAA